MDIGYIKATGHSVKIYLPKTATKPEVEFEWKIPKWSNAIERDRARTYFQAYAAAAALYFVEKALEELHAGRTKTWTDFKVPDEAIGCGFHEAVRGVLSHHVVIRDGKIANYHPYPPTPWNASPRDIYGTPGPYEDAVQNTPIFEENGPDNFKGIDIMRAVRSFDPCLPCGVHMYLGNGKVARDCTTRRSSASRLSDAASTTESERRIAAIEELVQRLETAADPATRAARRSWCARCWSCTAPASTRMLDGRSAGTARPAPRSSISSLATTWWRACCCCTACTRWTCETRVRAALEKSRPYLQSHGGNVELVGIDADGVVRLRMQGSCHGCPSSAVTLKLAIEQAIHEAAPDVSAILVEGQTLPGRPDTLITLGAAAGGGADGDATWQDVPELDGLIAGRHSPDGAGWDRRAVLSGRGQPLRLRRPLPGLRCRSRDRRPRRAARSPAPRAIRRYDIVQAGPRVRSC